MERPGKQTRTKVRVYEGARASTKTDRVVTEEPLEIRITQQESSTTLAITMRTPGHDFELAAGFLVAEGVVSDRDDVVIVSYCRDTGLPREQLYNIVIVDIRPGLEIDAPSLQRHFHTSSACGVCGKASLEALELRGVKPVTGAGRLSIDVIRSLPDRLRQAQSLFDSTGGLHAAALFTFQGDLDIAREDVGRHNAVDKVVGRALLDGRLPLGESILMVSGRTSYEICQKAVTAGIPVVCSVSAPSSLAVDVAERFDMTLVGFLRGDRFNVYSGTYRLD